MDNDKFLREVRAREMHALVSSGKTLQQTADMFDVTRERVRQVLKAHGFPTRSPKSGKVCEICFASYHISEQKSHRNSPEHLAMHDKRGSGEKIPGRHAAVVAEYLRGDKIDDIAERWGFHREYVFRILELRGVKPNRGGGGYFRTSETLKKYRTAAKAAIRNRANSEALIARVGQLSLQQGWSGDRIAAELGLSKSTVYRHRRIALTRIIPPYDTHSTGSDTATGDRLSAAAPDRSTDRS